MPDTRENVRQSPDSPLDEPPLGDPLPGWTPPPAPPRAAMTDRFCRVEPLNPEAHAAELFAAYSADRENRIWTYLPYGPFGDLEAFRNWMEATCRGDDPLFHAIVDPANGKAVGVASYLRIAPAAGSIEVGHINYSPALQGTAIATEAMYLMMARVFELGYRRYEWKCNALNAGSCRAAERLGFTFEGVFRQAAVIKGRNRDTAWYSLLDREWPQAKAAFEAWLAPANFDGEGRQKRGLKEIRDNL